MQTLSEKQIQTLRSAIDRIIPKDDFPSASELGVVDFLLRLIVLEDQVDQYALGLDRLEASALLNGSSFSGLSEVEQDKLLARMSTTSETRHFIDALSKQTIEGYYSDPGNGGNRDSTSWKMIGFEVRS